MAKTVSVTVSATGTYHRMHANGVSTFCGRDLSDPRRHHWDVFDTPLDKRVLDAMCKRCMPDNPAGTARR